MRYQVKTAAATYVICVTLVGFCPVPTRAEVPAPQESKQQPRKQESRPSTSLTGCVDEQEGRYILVDERNLNPIADLVADGFPTEGFAKHVGHKVIVRGASGPEGAHPVFRVRNIETVSEVCAPQSPQQEKK
jgi:hypothetical protein